VAQIDPNWERVMLERSRQRRADRLRSLLIQPDKRGQATGACFRFPQRETEEQHHDDDRKLPSTPVVQHARLRAGSRVASHARWLAIGTETLLPSGWKLALVGLLLLAGYTAALTLTGLTASTPPMLAITLAASVSSIAGFAFSPISQALLAPFLRDPVQIVEILMVCSITTQTFAIVSLWRDMDWRGLLVYLAGGTLGLPIGIYLLLHLGLHGFHIAVGVLMIVYGTYVLLKRPITLPRTAWPADVAVGFLGGITGGIAAFPGAAITVWCSTKGWDKTRQRGVYQPYILTMQVMALILLAGIHSLAASGGLLVVPYDAFLFVPGTLLGTWIGLRIFHNITDRNFGRYLAALLTLTGVLMLV